jgi:hypothetical protein
MLDHLGLTRTTLPCLALLLSAAGCAASVEAVDPVENASEALSSQAPPEVPAILAVPEGNKLAFSADASGTQNYICAAKKDDAGNVIGYGWTLQAPEATLYGRHGRKIGSHFAGPTWQANDGSTVVGTRLQGVNLDPSAIDWLLLQAKSNTGCGLMSKVSYVQRLETVGGLAPTTGCDAAAAAVDPQVPVKVEYTATYYFYEAAHGHKH